MKYAGGFRSFLSGSAVSEFHTALGQYLNYRLLMQGQYPEYTLYLAIPLSVYDSFFQLPFVQTTIEQYQLKLVVYMPEEQEIVKWQN
ncbi:MAG: element excision factor XisH family protein [Pseudanabaena sp.]